MNKRTSSLLLLLFSVLTLAFSAAFRAVKANVNPSKPAKSLKILVLTGGHGYDTLDFRNMFGQMTGLQIEHALLDKTATFFDDISEWNYDVLVFYNFRNKLTDAGKANFLQLCEQGVGLVFLHHSVMGFDDWPEFKNIVGAKYYFEGEAPKEKLGTYRHDVTMNIKIKNSRHPITKRLKDFQLYDEVYGNYWVAEENDLLMTTDHAESQPEIGWTRGYKQSKVVFIQPGHGKESLRDERYAGIVKRAILWAGGRL